MSIDLLDWTRQSQVQNRPGALVAPITLTATVGGATTGVLVAAVAGRSVVLYSIQAFMVPGQTVAVGDGDRSSPVQVIIQGITGPTNLAFLEVNGPKPVDTFQVVSGFGPAVGVGVQASVRAGWAGADVSIVAVYQVT